MYLQYFIVRKKIIEIISKKQFQTVYKILGILFIGLTFFISVSPDSFIKFGYLGVVGFNIVSSGLVVIPVLVERLNIVGVVFSSAFGNAVNTSINYFIGATTHTLFSNNIVVKKLKQFMDKFGLFAVYILAIVPMPLDLNGLLSGYFRVPFKKYLIVNFLGKITVFFLVALGVITISNTIKK